jgi:adenylosuccinate lyase
MTNHSSYQSPFSWRYGSKKMREIWSVEKTRLLWRRIWVALAEAQVSSGLVSAEQAASLANRAEDLDLARSFELEKELSHDLMAELTAFGEACPEASGILHLGATSMDIKDNALVMQQKEALHVILVQYHQLLFKLADLIQQWADFPLLGYTHLQPAEPTTLGYRLAGYGQELLLSYQDLLVFSQGLKAKGFTGAVGTSASFATLIGEENLPAFQELMAHQLELEFFRITNQTYPRLQDYQLLSRLAGVGATLYRLAFDVRILQSPGFGEVAEPFGEKQVGSSAMPFKQNPIISEKINSLGRYLAQLPRIAWDNAAHSLLERTLDDSANQRIYLPEAFLCLDEIMSGASQILSGLEVRSAVIQENLDRYQLFVGTEKLLMELVKVGANRGEMHAVLREQALKAWDAIRGGDPNPILDLLSDHPALTKFLDRTTIAASLQEANYLGDAPGQAHKMAEKILKTISNNLS